MNHYPEAEPGECVRLEISGTVPSFHPQGFRLTLSTNAHLDCQGRADMGVAALWASARIRASVGLCVWKGTMEDKWDQVLSGLAGNIWRIVFIAFYSEVVLYSESE